MTKPAEMKKPSQLPDLAFHSENLLLWFYCGTAATHHDGMQRRVVTVPCVVSFVQHGKTLPQVHSSKSKKFLYLFFGRRGHLVFFVFPNVGHYGFSSQYLVIHPLRV